MPVCKYIEIDKKVFNIRLGTPTNLSWEEFLFVMKNYTGDNAIFEVVNHPMLEEELGILLLVTQYNVQLVNKVPNNRSYYIIEEGSIFDDPITYSNHDITVTYKAFKLFCDMKIQK